MTIEYAELDNVVYILWCNLVLRGYSCLFAFRVAFFEVDFEPDVVLYMLFDKDSKVVFELDFEYKLFADSDSSCSHVKAVLFLGEIFAR